MSKTITTASGATRTLPENIEPERVAGLDPEGRIVVDDFGARAKPVDPDAPFSEQPFLFGLTLCCDASDKGVEDGVVCRACYGDGDIGAYLFRASDGTFPGLDPVASIA